MAHLSSDMALPRPQTYQPKQYSLDQSTKLSSLVFQGMFLMCTNQESVSPKMRTSGLEVLLKPLIWEFQTNSDKHTCLKPSFLLSRNVPCSELYLNSKAFLPWLHQHAVIFHLLFEFFSTLYKFQPGLKNSLTWRGCCLYTASLQVWMSPELYILPLQGRTQARELPSELHGFQVINKFSSLVERCVAGYQGKWQNRGPHHFCVPALIPAVTCHHKLCDFRQHR